MINSRQCTVVMRESGAKTKNEMLDELLPGDLCNVRPLTEGE